MLIITTFAAALSLASHDVTVEHEGASYQLRYRPEVTTSMRTIGAAPSGRQSTERCVWTVRLSVERQLAKGEKAGTGLIAGEKQYSGSHPGHCVQAGAVVQSQIEDKRVAMQEETVRIAQRDMDRVRADIEVIRRSAVR